MDDGHEDGYDYECAEDDGCEVDLPSDAASGDGVQAVGGDRVVTEGMDNRPLGVRRNCDLLGSQVDLPVTQPRDVHDPVDFGIYVIPKIENEAGVANLDEIVVGSGSIMVARGDQGLEISQKNTFVEQKMMIACATEGLDAEMRHYAVISSPGHCVEDTITGAVQADFALDMGSAGGHLTSAIDKGDHRAGKIQG